MQTLAELLEHDSQSLLKITQNSYQTALAHFEQAQKVELPYSLEDIQQVLICGMGGSGVTGDFIQLFSYNSARVPVSISKGPVIPPWVSKNTLVVCVSYSGNTAETLSCYEMACAQNARVMVVTTGGTLGQWAQENAHPIVPMQPGKMPRAALFDLLFSVLGILQKSNPLGLASLPFRAGLERLNTCAQEWSSFEGSYPLQLAQALHEHHPILWGEYAATDLIALRWKNQLSENSKVTSYYNYFPELNHNEIVNMCARHHSQSCLLYLNLDRDGRWYERSQISLKQVRSQVSQLIEVEAQGDSRFEKQIYLTYLADYVSIYLAFLRGVDPSPIEAIESLKQEMSQHNL